MKKIKPLLRIIDANINRYKEGIRVVEDIYRYIYNDKSIASKLKSLRHIQIPIAYEELLSARDSLNDVLKPSTKSEQTRKDINSIILANIKRAQESSRVLEEIFKLQDTSISQTFKNNRYLLYDIEKTILSTQKTNKL